MSFRTDRNNNPAAITTDVAKQGGLILNVDYVPGDLFLSPPTLVTAKLLHDPIELTIKVIDNIGYQTHTGTPRWTYINIPRFIWNQLPLTSKRDVVGYHYLHEGGDQLKGLFPNYGQM